MPADEPCPVPLHQSVAALRREGRALDPIVEGLTPQDMRRPTRLDAWNVRELLAHLIRAPQRLTTYLTGPAPPEPEIDWLGYWQAAREQEPVSIAQRARSAAQRSSDDELRSQWAAAWPEATVEAAHSHPSRALVGPFGAMRLDHYITTRVVEVTVHGLDLRAALDLEEVATPAGLEVTCAVLEGLLGVSRPVDLARDDLAFVLAATGRAAHDDPDLPVLA